MIVHFLNGNDLSVQHHYEQKEYRNDIFIEIDGCYYEVYFFTQSSLEHEMRKEGFLSLPGIIILDEIKNDLIFLAITDLLERGWFNYFMGHTEMSLNRTFANRWYDVYGPEFDLSEVNSVKIK